MLPDIIIRKYLAFYNKALAKRDLKPRSLDFWMARRVKLQRLRAGSNVLTPSVGSLKSRGGRIPVKPLSPLLQGHELGAWTLDQDTIRILWERLQIDRPASIVECGSGVSTLVFSQYLKAYQPTGRLLSFEQDVNEKQRVERLLREHDLLSYVTILVTPVDQSGRYVFQLADIQAAWDGQKADWLMIDGPSGPNGCRDNIPLALKPILASGARWWMDDSFRDGELEFLESWGQSAELSVEGIYPIGKGLSTGIMH